MKKSNLQEIFNATSFGMQELDREIIATVSQLGEEGIPFKEGLHPYGFNESREELELTGIRYNKEDECLEARDVDGEWFPIHTSLAYEVCVDPLELAEFILKQDVFED